MIDLPYVSLPEHFIKLLVANIQVNSQTNNSIETYINEHRELNALVRKIFRDIDPDGFLGKIISVSGWIGIRNRLAAVYIEYALTEKFPESANLNLIEDILSIENKLRHFTLHGYHRAFLLGFYAKMSLLQTKYGSDKKNPLVIKDEHFEYMKWSKSKSVRIDWLMLQLVLFDHVLGTERLERLLSSGSRYSELMALLSPEEQKKMIENFLTYSSSIGDMEIYLSDLSIQH